MMKEKVDIENMDVQLFKIKIIEPDSSKPASFTHYLHNHTNGVPAIQDYNDLGVTCLKKTGQANRYNLFVRTSQKGFSLLSLTL